MWRWVVLLGWMMAAAGTQAEPSHSVAQVNADGVLVMIDPALHGEQSLTAARVMDPASLSDTRIEFRSFPELWQLALPDWAPTEPVWLAFELTTAQGEAIEVMVHVDPHATVLGPVRSGQTLWQLARQRVETAADEDPRSAGDWVRRLHELNPAAFEDGAMDRLRQGALLLTDPALVRPIVMEIPVEVEPVAVIETDMAVATPAGPPPAIPAPQADRQDRASERTHYSPINPLTGVAGTVVVLVIAVFALAKAWRSRRQRPSNIEARLAAQFAQRGRADLARAWWAEALLKADTEKERQALRSALRAKSSSTTGA